MAASLEDNIILKGVQEELMVGELVNVEEAV